MGRIHIAQAVIADGVWVPLHLAGDPHGGGHQQRLGRKDIFVLLVAFAHHLFEKVDMGARIGLPGDQHDGGVVAAKLFPVGDAPGKDLGQLIDGELVDRVGLVDDHRQRIDGDHDFLRVDAIGARIFDFLPPSSPVTRWRCPPCR